MTTDPTPKVRWWPAPVIAAVGGIALAAAWHMPNLIRVAIGIVTLLALAAWLVEFSNLTRGAKAAIALVVAVLLIAAWQSVRVDGFSGDARPIWAWRWSPSPVDKFRAAEPVEKAALESLASGQFDSSTHDYPGFLGAQRDATVTGVALATDWEAQPPKQLWRHAVGPGWSSFAVVGGIAVTQEQRGDAEAVVCYELETGREIWEHLDEGVHFSETYGGDGPRATPTIADRRVYALGATGLLNCLDAETGQPAWSRNIIEDAPGARVPIWGFSNSPLVYDNVVVVNAGGTEDRSVIAYDCETGEPAWHAGNSEAAYSSPMLVTLAGVRQVLLLNGRGLEGYAADGSGRLWQYPWETNGGARTNIPQPIYLPGDGETADRVFISTGYGKGCALVEITRENEEFQVRDVFPPNRNLKSKFSNVIHVDGVIYGFDDGVAAALDLSNGRRAWKARTDYGHGQLLLVGDLILVQAEPGHVALMRPDPARQIELTRFAPLAEKSWNNPVLVGSRLLVRNDREAACYELPLAEPASASSAE